MVRWRTAAAAKLISVGVVMHSGGNDWCIGATVTVVIVAVAGALTASEARYSDGGGGGGDGRFLPMWWWWLQSSLPLPTAAVTLTNAADVSVAVLQITMIVVWLC